MKASIILHEVYFSYDLVFHFLREWDVRHGSVMAKRYAETVFSQQQLPIQFMNLKMHV
jgi:hypothetical protein